MPTHRVDSAAVGANDGTSWVDAWVSIASAFTNAIAGDTVLVDDGHSEDLNVNPSAILTSAGTLANPIKFHCVDKADDSLSTGASVTNGGAANPYNLYFEGYFFSYGIDWSAGKLLGIGALGVRVRIEFEQSTIACALNTTGSVTIGFSVSSEVIFREVDVDLSRAASSLYLRDKFIWRGGSLITTTGSFLLLASDGYDSYIEGVDLSVQAGNLVVRPVTGTTGQIKFSGCDLHAGVTILSAEPLLDPANNLLLTHCQAGVDGDPSYAMQSYSHYGDTKVDVAHYRTGGATDGERANPISWAMVTNANAKEIVATLESPPMGARWTPGDGVTEYTYTIYFASDAAMQDDEFWAELSVPNDDDTSSQVKILSSRLAPQSTPANITADGDSTWNGAGVGVKQKLVFTHTPDKPGIGSARLFLAKPSDTLYVDPKIYITPTVQANERTMLIPGHGGVYEGDSGAAGGLLVHPGMDGGLSG